MPVTQSDTFLCRMVCSEWNNGLATPTYFVSQKKKKGFFSRIQDALDTIPPNSRVEVIGGGTFTEKITVERPVELCVKTGDVAAVLCFRSTTLIISAETALLRGFIVDTDSSCPSVVVTGGRCVIQHCCISSLEVNGMACPTVQVCRFGALKGQCVHLRQKAGCFFQSCVFTGVTGCTILVESSGPTTFSDNIIAGSSQGQVWIRGLLDHDSAPVEPRFMFNFIVDRLEISQEIIHQMGGIDFGPLDKMSQPITQRNSGATDNVLTNTAIPAAILSGADILAGNIGEVEKELRELPPKLPGMRVSLVNAQKMFLANLLNENITDPAVCVGKGFSAAFLIEGPRAQPRLEHNTIQGCKLHGFVLRQEAGGWFEGNCLSKNKGWAVLLESTGGSTVGSRSLDGGIVKDKTEVIPTFVSNHISSNRGGMKICGTPVRVQQENVFFSNRGPQIYIEGGHEMILVDRVVFRNVAGAAVWCVGGGGGTVSGCEFESCGVAFRLERYAHLSVSRCIVDTGGVGAYITQGARGVFSRCVFNDILQVGASIHHASRPTFKSCAFLSCNQGLLISQNSRPEIIHCAMQDCHKKSIEVTRQAQPHVAFCVILGGSGTEGAVHCTNRSGGSFFRNRITRHFGLAAIVVENESDPLFDSNIIDRSAKDGIIVQYRGCGVFRHNVISSCRKTGVVITGPDTAPVFRLNFFINHGEQGLLISDSLGYAVVEKNIFLSSTGRCHVRLSTVSSRTAAVQEIQKGSAAQESLCKPVVDDSEENERRKSSVGGSRTFFSGRGSAGFPSEGGGALSRENSPALPLLVMSSHSTFQQPVKPAVEWVDRHCIIRGNLLGASCYAGVCMEGEVHAMLQGNSISYCRYGVLVYGNDARVVLLENRVSHCTGGVVVYDKAEVCLTSNLIHSISPGSAVSVVNASKVGIAFNVILGCQQGIFLHSIQEDALVLGNVIRECVSSAIYQKKAVSQKSRILQNVMKENGVEIITTRKKG